MLGRMDDALVGALMWPADLDAIAAAIVWQVLGWWAVYAVALIVVAVVAGEWVEQRRPDERETSVSPTLSPVVPDQAIAPAHPRQPRSADACDDCPHAQLSQHCRTHHRDLQEQQPA